MKKLIFTFIAVSVISCSQSHKYEKLISEYAQTDKQGVFTDCQFEAIEIKELPPITVSDSINILKEEFQKNTMKSLELEETYLKNTKENLRREENSRFKIKTTIDMYNKHILSAERRVDSIKQLQFTNRYDNSSPSKVLLQPIECRYSYVFPVGDPRQERTDIFYFLPDFSKITGQKQIKK